MRTRSIFAVTMSVLLAVPAMAPGAASAQVSTGVSAVASVESSEIPSQNAEDFLSSELAPSQGDITPVEISPEITPVEVPEAQPTDELKPQDAPTADVKGEEPSPLLEGEGEGGSPKAPTAQRLPSLPKTSGQFSTDLFTGSASYAYHFEVPEGRAGLTPPLALRYSSARRTEFGSAGARGWDFEVGHIERTSRYGVDKIYTASSTFTLYPPGGGGSVELAPLELVDGIHGTYGAKVENDFSLITFATSNSWTIVDRSGVTWTYGTSTFSREYDPNDEARTSSWYVADVLGPTGATMHYAYVKDGNVAYLNEVRYGGQLVNGSEEAGPLAVSITWATSSDGNTSYRSGFVRNLSSRIVAVDAYVGGQIRHRYSLAQSLPLSNGLGSSLASVQEISYTAESAVSVLPPTVFTYHPALPVTWNTSTSTTTDIVPRPLYECYIDNNHPMPQCGDPGTSIADMNGDGRDDVIVSDRYANNGGGHFVLASTVYFRQLDGSWVADHGYATSVPAIADMIYSQWWGAGFYHIMDLNGDRLADVFMNLSYQANGRIYINNGHGFDLAPYSAPIMQALMGDINGDGLPDLVNSSSSNSYDLNFVPAASSLVYLNTGSGWQRDEGWAVPFSLDNCVPWTHGCLSDARYWQASRYRLVDVNHDGLSDAVYSYRQTDGPHQALFLNTGRGWTYATSSAWGQFPDFYTCVDFSCQLFRQRVLDVVDMNGDGGDDFVVRNGGDVAITPGKPYQQQVLEPHNLPTVSPNPPESDGHGVSAAATRFADFNGDGQFDLVYGYQDQRPESYPPYREDYRLYTQVKQPDYLLQSVTEPTGAVTTLQYTEAHQYYDAEGQPLNENLPYAVWTPSRVTVNPGNGQPEQVTDYTYEGGAAAWTNPNDREFAGFWKVTATTGDTKTITEFHQGIGGLPLTTSTQLHDDRGQYMDMPAKRGRAYRTEVIDSATGNALSAQITRWKHAPLEQGEGRMFVFPGMSSSFTRESNGGYVATGVERYYDLANGNEYETRTHGVAEVDMGNGYIYGDLGNDQTIQSYSYASSAAHILGAPQLASVGDLYGGSIAEKEIRYDGLPLGQVSQGKPTRVEDKLPSSAVYATYDSYANVSASSDPRGATTTFSYDAAYHLAPTASTNPLGQVSLQEVDLATRQLSSSTDANGSRERWIRDGFGRPLERWIQNPDSPGIVLAERWTYGDSARPVWVRHEAFDSIGDLEPGTDYAYADGLGRVIQTRALEATSTYIISDTAYDSQGRVVRQSLPYRGTGSAYATSTGSVPSTTYAYDAAGRVTAVYAPAGNTTVEYDGLVTRVTDALGRVAEQERDGQGRLVRVTRWLNSQPVTYSYAWDAAGRLTGMADPGGNTREFTYDGQGRLLAQTDWHATSSSPDVWAYAYDAAGNVTSSTDPRGRTIHYTYDALNRVLTANDPSTPGTDTTYSYDHTGSFGVGKLREAIHAGVRTTYEYDRLGRATLVDRSILGERFEQSYRYDLAGRESIRTEPRGGAILTEYDRLGRWSATRWAEEAGSSSTSPSVVGSLQFNQQLQYAEAPDDPSLDIVGQVTIEAWVKYPSVPSANYGYTILSKGTDVSASSFNYWFLIGEADHLVFVLRTGSGPGYYVEATTTLGDAGTGWHHYAVTFDDAADTVLFYRDGQRLGGAYSLYAPLETNDQPVRIGLDAAPNFRVSMVGSLSEVRLWSTVRTPSQIYDSRYYRLSQVPGLAAAWPLNDLGGPAAIDASGNGNVATLSTTTTPVWSSDGLSLLGVNGPFNPQPVAVAQAYTPLGQLQQVQYGNGLVTRDTYTLEDGYRLARRTTGEEGSYLQDISYTYDAVGNVTHLVDASAEPLGKDHYYTYDDLDRLVGVQGTNAYSEPADASSTFSYDQLGNMRTRGDHWLYRLAYSTHPYRASHAVIGGDGLMPFTWDAAGNLTEVGSNLYSYDGFGRLATATYWSGENGYVDIFRYDHAGQRAYRTHDDTGDGLDPAATYQLGTYEEDLDKAARLFVDAPGRRLAQVSVDADGHPAIQYLHPDALGSSPLATDASGELASAVDQDPYGLQRMVKENGLPAPARSYTGKELDPSSWYYYGARYYDPASARFTQVDPVTLQLGQMRPAELAGLLSDPRRLHPYSYAANNPVKYQDPDGQLFDVLLDIGFIAYDLYRIGSQLASQGHINKGELLALGADVGGAFIPGATGLGVMARTAMHADDVAKAGKVAVKAVEEVAERGGFTVGEKAMNHIVNGDRRGGVHMFEKAVENRKLIPGARTDLITKIIYGVETKADGFRQLKTMFPVHWTETMVGEAVQKLAENGTVQRVGRNGVRYIQANFAGITVEGTVNARNIMTSAYPVARHLRLMP